jgi:hypothetical protein
VLDNIEVEAIDTALTESTIPMADVPALSANAGGKPTHRDTGREL